MKNINLIFRSFLLLLSLTTGIVAQNETLESLFKAHSYPLTVSGGKLSGSGMDLLMRASADAQFFILAEQHNSKLIPEITIMLFDSLHDRYGFNYLALEQDPVMCRMVSAKSVVGKLDYVVSQANRYPNAFTFITDQELEMIARAGKISKGKGNRIWGLDQAFGALHILNRLKELTSNTEVRNRLAELIKTAEEYEIKRYVPGRRYMMPEVSKTEDFKNLLQLYQPKKGSEEEFLINELLTSIRIYEKWASPSSRFEANYTREENMKALFMNEYRKAQGVGEEMPKVLLKFGHVHAMRGLNPSNVLSLGNFVTEFAKRNNTKSFLLTMWVNNASGNYSVLSKYDDYKAIAKATPTDRWTIVDFRPLRNFANAGKIQDLNPEMRRAIYSYDAALIIGGDSLGTFHLTANK